MDRGDAPGPRFLHARARACRRCQASRRPLPGARRRPRRARPAGQDAALAAVDAAIAGTRLEGIERVSKVGAPYVEMDRARLR
jgi:hypothetical protein